MSKAIELTRGLCAIVDDDMYEYLNQWKWTALKNGKKFYAFRMERKKGILMHRVVNQTPDGMMADHIDGNGLNNQKSNLRSCTPSENTRNQLPREGRYKGVVENNGRGKRWRAQLWMNHKCIHLGYYEIAEEAARAYDRAAKKFFGQFACLNFPEGAR